MPYMMSKRGNEWCVYKRVNGRASGKPLGCHPSPDKAQAQMRAINASEHMSDKQLTRPTQMEVNYTPLSGNPAQVCRFCRWFIGAADGGPACHLIENYPVDVVASGYCDRFETAMMNMDSDDDMMMDMEGEHNSSHEDEYAMADMAASEPAAADAHPMNLTYIAPRPEGTLKHLTRRVFGGLQPGLSVTRDKDGKRLILLVTSNSYQDREQETITTDALKYYVKTNWTGDESAFIGDNPLLFWHDDRVKLGTIVYADVHKAFLIEVAREDDTPLARKVLDYVEAHPEEGWGASHRFGYFSKDRTADGVYAKRIFKQETTLLPRSVAANLLTFSGVIPMTNKKGDYLNKMLGLPNATELLDKGLGALIEALQAQGVEHKSVDEDGHDHTEESGKGYETLLADLIGGMADLDERLETQTAERATAEKSYTDTVTSLTEQVKGLTEKVGQLEAAAKAQPRAASRAQETEIDPDKLSADIRKTMTKRDPFWGTEVIEG